MSSGNVPPVMVPLQLATAGFNRAIDQAASKIQSLVSLGSRGVGLGTILGAGAGGLSLAELGRHAMDMEVRFARLRRAADTSRMGFVALKDDLTRFATYASGVKLDNLFEIATVGAKMGIAGDELNLFTRDMAKVSTVLEDIPIGEATNRIASMLSVFHRGSDEAIRMASSLNALDLASTASARNILDVSSRMSGMASYLGMSPQKVMALATATQQARISPESAGTAMSQLMGRLASKKTAGGFAKIAGMGKQDFMGTLAKDPLEAIKKLEEGLRGMDHIAGVNALEKLHLDGQRTRGTLLQLGTVMNQLNGYVATSEREWATMNSIQESSNIIAATATAQWERVASNFKLTAASVGQGLLPAIKGLAEGMVNLMVDARGWIDRNQATFEGWGRRVGEVLSRVGGLIRTFPLYAELARVTFAEKFEQVGEIIRRTFVVARNFVKVFATDAARYISAMAQKVAIDVGNVIAGAMGLKGKAPMAMPTFGANPLNMSMGDRVRMGVAMDERGKAWTRDGIMAGLPNRAAERANAGANVAAELRAQRAERHNAVADDAAKDAAARKNAEVMRRGPLPAGRPAVNFGAFGGRLTPQQQAARDAMMARAAASAKAREDQRQAIMQRVGGGLAVQGRGGRFVGPQNLGIRIDRRRRDARGRLVPQNFMGPIAGPRIPQRPVPQAPPKDPIDTLTSEAKASHLTMKEMLMTLNRIEKKVGLA